MNFLHVLVNAVAQQIVIVAYEMADFLNRVHILKRVTVSVVQSAIQVVILIVIYLYNLYCFVKMNLVVHNIIHGSDVVYTSTSFSFYGSLNFIRKVHIVEDFVVMAVTITRIIVLVKNAN